MPSIRPTVLSAITVAPDEDRLCELVANRIVALVRSKHDAVLGLATGSTPLGVYARLLQWHRHGSLDFSGVTCFNLDEYYPLASESPYSYHHFMQQNLFRHINCSQWFVPDGSRRSDERIARDCREYEARIASVGGIDLQILGIGRSGHIGFNEPGSAADSRTRLVTLHPLTLQDAAASFGGIEFVPRQAVTMGMGTILDAREIVMMARGAAKAEIIRTAWTDDISARIPASYLRTHPKAHLYLDTSAARLLHFSL